MVDGNHHTIPQAGHIPALIGHLLNGGPGEIAAAVEPDQHRALPLTAGSPHIQIQAVLILDPVAMGYQQLAAGLLHTQQRADTAVAGGIQRLLPGGNRLRRTKPSGPAIGNPLENLHIPLTASAYRPPDCLHQRSRHRTERLKIHKLSPLSMIAPLYCKPAALNRGFFKISAIFFQNIPTCGPSSGNVPPSEVPL